MEHYLKVVMAQISQVWPLMVNRDKQSTPDFED